MRYPAIIGLCWGLLVGCSSDEGTGGGSGGGAPVGGSSSGGADGSGASSSGGQGTGGNGEPVDVGQIAASKRRIAAGRRHACAVTDERELVCWGFGQAGSQNSPPQGTGYDSVFAGDGRSCALTAQGAADCWGDVALV